MDHHEEYLSKLKDFRDRETAGIEAASIINRIWCEQSVELLLFRRNLYNESPLQILKDHLYARQIALREMTVFDTLPIIRALSEMKLCRSRIDVGTLTMKWQDAGKDASQLGEFLETELADFKYGTTTFQAKDVVLYGFGRIGRLMARIFTERAGAGETMNLKAIVCRPPVNLKIRVNLLRRDSVHGSFKGLISYNEEAGILNANGVAIKFIEANDPSKIDYTAYGINNALVIDNTGGWRDRDGLGLHLKAKGVDRVLLTAPGKGDIPNLVYGVNHREWQENERIFSAASCTTNAIVPPLKVLNDIFGIEYGHIETVHSYTNDQNLLDNFHKKERRGRSAALNMVITETGAASAVAKALPELTGRISGNAVRVPTPNVSLAILNLTLSKEASREAINDTLRRASLTGDLVSQIDYTRDEDVVSSDMIGNRHPAIVDSLATQVHGRHAAVYVWYDNEFGYSVQVDRVARVISGVEPIRYY